MKSYLISVGITAVIIALSELIIPQGKLKTVVTTVLSIVLLIAMINPFAEIDFDQSQSVFNPTEQESSLNNGDGEYFDRRLTEYYQKIFKEKLKSNDLICEKVIVEISQSSIKKIQIFLSNLVIPENNEHINNNVIANYVAEILGIDASKVEIYA